MIRFGFGAFSIAIPAKLTFLVDIEIPGNFFRFYLVISSDTFQKYSTFNHDQVGPTPFLLEVVFRIDVYLLFLLTRLSASNKQIIFVTQNHSTNI